MALPPVTGFIDMDCFYVAVERARDARLIGRPCAVVQYNTSDRSMNELSADANRWRTGGAMGGIIAVSYEARARGVTRQMMGPQARKVCPEIVLIQVPVAFGKADLRIYKAAGDEVVALLAKRADATEKRSVDEVAIDITSEAERLLAERDWSSDLVVQAKAASHLADSALSRQAANVSREDTRKGHEGQHSRQADDASDAWGSVLTSSAADPVVRRLVAGAVVVAELRSEIKEKLGFSCSGGVATNKLLAKLGCGLHKPDQQTILLPHAVPALLKDLPLDRLPGLGGDLGNLVKSKLAVETAGQLVEKRDEAMVHFPEKGEWLVALASGLDSAADPVKDRQLVKSLSNGKTFFGSSQLRSLAEVEYWLGELAGELHRRYAEQVEQHQRAPTTIGIHVGTGGGRGKGMKGSSESFSKQQSIDLGRNGSVAQIATAAKACFLRWHAGAKAPDLAVTSLGLSLTNMTPLDGGAASIKKFFGRSGAQANVKPAPVEQQEKPPAAKSTLASFFAKATAAAEVVQDSPPQAAPASLGLDAAEVDESVLAELPPSIQAEIRAQLAGSRGSSAGALPPAKRQRCDVVEIDE
eukprot:TRINITY_DN35440_c0_g1_i1.p1 TRINITY_DN35440_c0_g1~~TRINITY_DN35440_c0_g1_i1.p1  ORF type:complete len:584 (+),score=155.31 TRINITY_DN35440_c0_g1_i1:79-1830(+)